MFLFKQKFGIIFACILLISACDYSKSSKHHNSLLFQPIVNTQPLTCRQPFLANNKSWYYTQFQFFISTIQFQNKQNKEWYNAPLTKSPYQTSDNALLGEYCGSSKKEVKGNWLLSFDKTINFAEVSHIRFTLGLPFSVNHLNPLTQESPLNTPSMFWGWQKGHKFLRLELTTNGANSHDNYNDHWLFHLGSIGCQAHSPMRAPKEECLYPNRIVYELPVSPDTALIEVDITALIKDIILSQSTSCQSSPGNLSCQTLFKNLHKIDGESVFKLQPLNLINLKEQLNE